MSIFDITNDDIQKLNDSDLRSLIARLCEAELESIGESTAGVTWGGNQNASDGGIDIRVESHRFSSKCSYIPAATTLFQVKQYDITPNEIKKEICPNGIAREAIVELIAQKGSYIMVSGASSTSDSALKNRLNAMKEALCKVQDISHIKLDFYDSNRVASWVRSYPSLISWVKNKIGQPISGWEGYGNWSKSYNNSDPTFWIDESTRITHSKSKDADLSIKDGLQAIRKELHTHRSSIRLVGLSGVGKTRLVQALFDENIGDAPLPKTQVLYTNLSDTPEPPPLTLAKQLVQKRLIFVLDNCDPELHRKMAEVCRGLSSKLSLITIEYDVTDDQPEETHVFKLKPASTKLIEKIIESRFKGINDANAELIANFSDGNARIALALARTVDDGTNLIGLSDVVLFKRLFHQRNSQATDIELLRIAKVCSLVYSFNCAFDNENDELERLGRLAGASPQKIYELTSELQRREMLQQRGKWRAILPFAIANRLAQIALEDIPYELIWKEFKDNHRLVKSFAKRLGYLHASEDAQKIVTHWFSTEGILGNLNTLNQTTIAVFENIAPVNCELTLRAIENAAISDETGTFLTAQNRYSQTFIKVLIHLAFEKQYFERCVTLLIGFSLTEEDKNKGIQKQLQSFFQIFFSGTHATLEQKIQVINKLLGENDNNKIDLGLKLLNTALGPAMVFGRGSFEFGSRLRDTGYSPKKNGEMLHWYQSFIDYTVKVILNQTNIQQQAKQLLADHFRLLCVNMGMLNALETAAQKIKQTGDWLQGWAAVRSTLKSNNQNFLPEDIELLKHLESSLAPNSTVEKVFIYTLNQANEIGIALDSHESSKENPNEIRLTGRELTNRKEDLIWLLPQLLAAKSTSSRMTYLGQGLADVSEQPEKLWALFRDELGRIEKSSRQYGLVYGFINGLSGHNFELSESLLKNAVTDPIFNEIFPILQTRVIISKAGAERIKFSLKNDFAPTWMYCYLGFGRIHETISDEDLGEIIQLIASKPNGKPTAIELLHMRFYSNKDLDPNNILCIMARGILNDYISSQKEANHQLDYEISEIVKVCFTGSSYENDVRMIARHLIINTGYNDSIRSYGRLIEQLIFSSPIAFLNGFLGDDLEDLDHNDLEFDEPIGNQRNFVSLINEDILIEWCEANPNRRYPIIAGVMQPFDIINKDQGGITFEWSSLAKKLLDSSHALVVLGKFKAAFYPNSWSGSRSALMRNRASLLEWLKKHPKPEIIAWAEREEVVINNEMIKEQNWEKMRHERHFQKFE